MKIFILILLSFQCLAIKSVRSEINRFRLLKDKNIIDKQLIVENHSSFFETNINISSGLKKLLGDISESTSELDETTQVTGVNGVLGQNVNTEKYLDLSLELGAPLPYFKINDISILSSVFISGYIGTSLSVNNQVSAISPTAQVYIQKEIKYGIHSQLKSQKHRNYVGAVTLYRRERSDASSSKDAVSVAADDKLVSLSEFNKSQNDYVLDFELRKINQSEEYIFQIQDLKLKDAGSELDNKIGNSPFLNFRYEKSYPFKNFKLTSFYGIHHRQKYSLFDGLYTGAKFSFEDSNPLHFVLKLDNQFFTYHAGLGFNKLKFHYGFKTPFRNPQENMWVSASHHIFISIPF